MRRHTRLRASTPPYLHAGTSTSRHTRLRACAPASSLIYLAATSTPYRCLHTFASVSLLVAMRLHRQTLVATLETSRPPCLHITMPTADPPGSKRDGEQELDRRRAGELAATSRPYHFLQTIPLPPDLTTASRPCDGQRAGSRVRAGSWAGAGVVGVYTVR